MINKSYFQDLNIYIMHWICVIIVVWIPNQHIYSKQNRFYQPDIAKQGINLTQLMFFVYSEVKNERWTGQIRAFVEFF